MRKKETGSHCTASPSEPEPPRRYWSANPVLNPEGCTAPPHAKVQTMAPKTKPLGQGEPAHPQQGEEGDHSLQPGPPVLSQQLPQRRRAGLSNTSSLPVCNSEELGQRVCPHHLCPPIHSLFEWHRGTDIPVPCQELHCIHICLCGIKTNIRREGLPTTETQLMGLSKLWQTSVSPGFQTQSP